jgi:hypothetical protein
MDKGVIANLTQRNALIAGRIRHSYISFLLQFIPRHITQDIQHDAATDFPPTEIVLISVFTAQYSFVSYHCLIEVSLYSPFSLSFRLLV